MELSGVINSCYNKKPYFACVTKEVITMTHKVKVDQKHLILEQRKYIEEALDKNMDMKEIAKFLSKDPTTISKEIKMRFDKLVRSICGHSITLDLYFW